MRFGVNTWVWVAPLTADSLKILAPKIAQMGFDWIEIPVENPGDLEYAAAREIIRDNGLGVSVCAAMGPDRDLIHPDATLRENGMAYLRHCIEAARALGAAKVGGPHFSSVGRVWQSTPDERARDTDLLVRQLGSLAAYAADRGAVLGVEPLNRFETSFINLTSQVIEVVDRVGSPACGVMLDSFHMNIEEDSLGDAIRAAGRRLVHFHACENNRGTPGCGHMPWKDIAAALHDIHYDGAVVIESFTDQVKSIARAAAIWRPLAPSQDKLAQDGLKFLRQLLA